MYGYIEGFSDTDDILYCPKCGERIYEHYVDGTGKCDNCGFRFGVIDCTEEPYDG